MTGRTRLLQQIVRALLPSEPELEPEASREVEEAVVAFVAAQIGSLPAFLRIPYSFALVGFDWLAVARYGRRYARLDETQGRRYLGAWDRSPVSLCRDFVKLLRSCTLLAYLDHPIVARRLETTAALEPGV
jgi:hypothetical protein